MSELIADACSNLIVAQLLLEPDEAKIQDRYRIHKGLARGYVGDRSNCLHSRRKISGQSGQAKAARSCRK